MPIPKRSEALARAFRRLAAIVREPEIYYFANFQGCATRQPADGGSNMGTGVEYRIMPNNGDGGWYWEVIKDGHEVVARGVANTEPAACEQANEAARKAKLVN